MWALYKNVLSFSDLFSEPPASRAEHGEEDARDVGTAGSRAVAPAPHACPAQPEPTDCRVEPGRYHFVV